MARFDIMEYLDGALAPMRRPDIRLYSQHQILDYQVADLVYLALEEKVVHL